MFQEWLKQRKIKEEFGMGSEPVDQFKFNTDDQDFADDHEHIQKELFKVVMSKYPEETLQFLNEIAARGDEEVASLLRKMQKDGPRQMQEPSHPTDGDEVVPSGADTGYGGGEGDD
jgi:hypothetical protein